MDTTWTILSVALDIAAIFALTSVGYFGIRYANILRSMRDEHTFERTIAGLKKISEASTGRSNHDSGTAADLNLHDGWGRPVHLSDGRDDDPSTFVPIILTHSDPEQANKRIVNSDDTD